MKHLQNSSALENHSKKRWIGIVCLRFYLSMGINMKHILSKDSTTLIRWMRSKILNLDPEMGHWTSKWMGVISKVNIGIIKFDIRPRTRKKILMIHSFIRLFLINLLNDFQIFRIFFADLNEMPNMLSEL
jgi:hypothetical protein